MPLIYNNQINNDFIETHTNSLLTQWLRLITNHPNILLHHQLCVSSMIWRISQPNTGYISTFVLTADSDNPDTAPRSKSIWLKDIINVYLKASLEDKNIWYIWRPALYLYTIIFCVVVASIRLRNTRLLVVMLPAIFNSLTLLVLIPAQDFRFQYPVYVTGLIAPALLFAGLKYQHLHPTNGLYKISQEHKDESHNNMQHIASEQSIASDHGKLTSSTVAEEELR